MTVGFPARIFAVTSEACSACCATTEGAVALAMLAPPKASSCRAALGSGRSPDVYGSGCRDGSSNCALARASSGAESGGGMGIVLTSALLVADGAGLGPFGCECSRWVGRAAAGTGKGSAGRPGVMRPVNAPKLSTAPAGTLALVPVCGRVTGIEGTASTALVGSTSDWVGVAGSPSATAGGKSAGAVATSSALGVAGRSLGSSLEPPVERAARPNFSVREKPPVVAPAAGSSSA